MGQTYGDWEQVTRSLLEEAEGERTRLTQRLTTVQEALAEVDQRVAAIQATLNAYWTKYGKTQTADVQPQSAGDDNYNSLTAKGMVLRWADQHGGRVVMVDLEKALVAMRIFKDPQAAAGAVYPAIRRLPGFSKVARGIYVRQPEKVDSTLAVKYNSQYESIEHAGEGASDRVLSRGQLDPQHSSYDRTGEEHDPETTGRPGNGLFGVSESGHAESAV